MATVLTDLRYAVRTLRKTPAFTLTVIVTLALGLGVNVAVFTLMNAALLESLPVRHAKRLVHVFTTTPQGGDHFDFSYPLYVDLRDGTRTLEGLAAYTSIPVGVSGDAGADRVTAEFVTANYFEVLGVDLPDGPGFSGADELRGAPGTAVISRRLSAALFNEGVQPVGRRLLVNGNPVTIVGVAPASFDGTTRGERAELWLPLPQFTAVRNRPDALLLARESSWLSLIGRLPAGASRAPAEAELTSIGRALNVINAGPDFTARTRPAAEGNTGLVESLTRPLTLLMLVVGLILVVAAANVANLLLARAHARQGEFAVRRAIGASRARIVRQMMTEGTVLAAIGGGLGVLLAYWVIAFFELRTAGGTLLQLRVEPNATVILFAVLLSAAVALASGLIPALTASRPDLLSVIKGGRDASQSRLARRHVRTALVVVQVALSFVLIAGASLFLRSLSRLQAIDPSLSTNRVVAATLNLTLRGYDEARARQFYADLLPRVAAIPGVEAASLAYVLPVTAGGMRMDIQGSSMTPAIDGMAAVELIPISPAFFQTVGVPLVAGRDFATADSPTGARVTIVNETMKERLWHGENPVGRPLSIAGGTYEVVGVARDTKYRSLRETARMVMYLPYTQAHEPTANLLVKTALAPESIGEGIRQAVRAVDPAMPLYNVRTLADHVGRSLYVDRLRAELIGYLAALAALIAAIGIYGVVSVSVSERTREVGIRVALGAQPQLVLRMILRSGLRFGVIGIAAGVLISVWLTRAIAADLFQITPTDPFALAAAGVMLLTIVLVATLIPARRATRIDPITALRTE